MKSFRIDSQVMPEQTFVYFTQKPIISATTESNNMNSGPILRVKLRDPVANDIPVVNNNHTEPFTPSSIISEPICQAILYDDISDSRYIVYVYINFKSKQRKFL